MVTDSQTNFLYLADTFPKKYPGFFERFESLLKECNIAFELLPNTKDVWAVDYMPIQKSLNEFIRFVYKPTYLTRYKKYLITISDVDAICSAIGIETIKTDILLDGGNVVKAGNKVIMTDRVFTENPHYAKEKLIGKLHELLEVENIIIIPKQPDDYTGHADGMIRFVDDDTVVINDFSREKKMFVKAFEKAIQKAGLNSIKIPYCVYENKSFDQANGDYINYLQMEDTLILPTFNRKEDEEVVKQFEAIFTRQTIKTIDSNAIADDGGVLNCISWNIQIN